MAEVLGLVIPDRPGLVAPDGNLGPDLRRFLLNLGQVATNLSELDGDHGVIGGLGDDDHPQYHNDARGDARYSQLGHAHAQYATIASPAFTGVVGLPSYNVAGLPAGGAGQVVYCSDGDAGSPCLAVHNGASWKRVVFGADVSAT